MEQPSKKEKDRSQKKIETQVKELLIERGSKALEQARNHVLQEKIESKETREALTYFMNDYWQDLVRPTLFSLACEAVGGNPDLVTRVSIPMILISGAIDIHDDIIDQSEVKGSRPTVLGKFGKDTALVAGDMLLVKGFTLLCEAVGKEIMADKAADAIITIKTMFIELGDAEALELGFRGKMDTTPEEYLGVVRKKAADIEAYTRISAILGGGSKEEVEALGQYGRLLGIMAILRDDLMDMFDFEETAHRIKRECLPLPILYALQNPEIKSTLSSILLKKEITKSDTKMISEIACKSVEFRHFEELMKKLSEDAYQQIGKLGKGKKRHLVQLIRSLVPQ